MRFEFTVVAAIAMAAVLANATPAAAAFPDFYSDAGDFQAQGTILSSTNFDSFGPDITVLTDNETFGPLTFSGGQLLVVGHDSYLNPLQNVIGNNLPADGLQMDIGPTGYNMLSFKLANLMGYGDQVFVELFTNVDSYAYGLYPGAAPEALTFYGFIVPEGEYFLGFHMNPTDFGSDFQPNAVDQAFGLTDIALGTTATICATRVCDTGGGVPEPASWALMIAGFGGVGAVLRSRRRPVLGLS